MNLLQTNYDYYEHNPTSTYPPSLIREDFLYYCYNEDLSRDLFFISMSTQIQNTIKKIVTNALNHIAPDIAEPEILLEHPTELAHGDYACNVAMRYAKELNQNPRELGEQIAQNISENLGDVSEIEKV